MTSGFLNEILEQPQALERVAAAYITHTQAALGDFDRVILTGMGSSLHACYPLYLTINRLGRIPAQLWDASELVHFGVEAIGERTLLVAVSQSGESAEIVELTRLGRRPALAIAVSNGRDNTLATWADMTLDILAGPEATVATKTYTTSLATLALLGAELTGGDIETARAQVLQAAAGLSQQLAHPEKDIADLAAFMRRCEKMAFMGRGPSLASARTAALITAESSKVHGLGLSSAQFRHGPLELVRPGFKAVVFAGSGPVAQLNQTLAATIAELGGSCLSIGPNPHSIARPNLMAWPIPFAPTDLLPIHEIVPAQLLTIALAQAKGIVPATFTHATKITREQ